MLPFVQENEHTTSAECSFHFSAFDKQLRVCLAFVVYFPY